MTKIVIEHVLPGALKPYARNARTHSPKQIAEIASSIKAFGFNNPVLIDKDNGIVAGHGRVEAACVAWPGNRPDNPARAPERRAEAGLHPRR